MTSPWIQPGDTEQRGPVSFAIIFSGGPYDGVMAFLPHPFKEVLHPRGEASGKSLNTGEAEFNISMYGKPYSPDVDYDRYESTNTIIKKDLPLVDGRIINGVDVVVYKYTGVVNDGTEPDDPQLI